MEKREKTQKQQNKKKINTNAVNTQKTIKKQIEQRKSHKTRKH